MKNSLKTISAIFLGSVLEWYDFGLFIFFMPVISVLFFPTTHHYLSLLYGYAVLAISYFMRPLGALIFGHYGDSVNKRTALILSMLSMSVPSLMIGLLPTYQQVGGLSAILLITLRLIQGFSAGGELMGAVTLTYELTQPPRRGPLSCLVWTGSGAGMLLASLGVTGLLHFIDKSVLMAWAWRIPFIFGAALGFIAFYLRHSYLYTKITPQNSASNRALFSKTLIYYKNKIFYYIALFSPAACIFYLGFFYMPLYASQAGGLSYSKALMINTVMMLSLQAFPTIFGYFLEFHDKTFWRKASLACLILLSLPLYFLISHHYPWRYLFLGQFCLAVATSMNASATMLTVLEDAPKQVQYTLIALSYNISYAVFGNLLPLSSIYLMFKWHFWLMPGITIMITCLFSGFYLLLPKKTFSTSFIIKY